MSLRTVDATLRHAEAVAKAMRARDVNEIRIGWARSPFQAMHEALASSYYAKTLFFELEPLCMFGLAPLSMLDGTARIWIFGTAAIDRHRFAFARASRLQLREIFANCRLITNLIDLSDCSAMRWMQWLGGTCVLPHHSRGGRLFAQFILVDGQARFKACQRG